MTNPNLMVKGERKGGRQKGTRNKVTNILKDAILLAGEKAGDGDLVAYLERQAKENPVAFMSLLGKVLPLQVNADVGVVSDPMGQLLEDIAKNGKRLGNT